MHRRPPPDRTATGLRRGNVHRPAAEDPPATAPAEARSVLRPRLLDLLQADPRPVTLLSAPAGSGKSTLLAALRTAAAPATLTEAPPAALTEALPTAVPLTALVEIDARLWTAGALWDRILTALRQTGALAPDTRLHALAAPPDAVGIGFLDVLVAAIEELGRPVRLLLDDLHELTDPAALASLDTLLLRPPDNLEVVLSTRSHPPLSLARLRLAGRLRELDGRDLAFDLDETAALAHEAGVALTSEQLVRLRARTEGWAMGLRVALLALHREAGPDPTGGSTDPTGGSTDPTGGSTDPSGVSPDPTDHHTGPARTVADDDTLAAYLDREVLDHLDPTLRRFLVRTSVCTPLPVELARALTDRDDAGELLEELVTRRILTERLGRGTSSYRVHAVLRSHLRAELERTEPTRVTDLHRRAGSWYLDVGASLTGLEHLARSGDEVALAAALRQVGIGLLLDGEERALAALLRPRQQSDDPVVRLLATVTCLQHQGPAASDAVLSRDALVRLAATEDDPWLATLAASTWVRRGTLGDPSLPAARDRLADRLTRPSGDPQLELWARFQLAYARLQLADLPGASAAADAVITAAELGSRDALSVDVHSALSVAALMTAHLDVAHEHATAALRIADRRGWRREPRTMPAHLTLAWLGYLQVLPELARQHLDVAGTSLGPTADPRLTTSLETCGVLLRLAGAGDPVGALRAHRRRLDRLEPGVMSATFHAHVAAPLVREALRHGERSWAWELADAHDHPGLSAADRALVQALLLVGGGRPDDARRTLAPVVGTVGDEPLVTAVRVRLLAADLDVPRGARVRAEGLVTEALALAAPQRLRRPFVDVSSQVRDLLIALADRTGRYRGFAHEVTELLAAPDPNPVLLTPAEAAILAELPSLLTVREIAMQRGVSANTVKTHLSALYRKLGAGNRREAVEAARGRGLL